MFNTALAAASCSAKMVGETSVFGLGVAAATVFVLFETTVDFFTATGFAAAFTVLTPFTAAILLFAATFFEVFSTARVVVGVVEVGF